MSANLRNRQDRKEKIPFLGNGTEWVILLISFLVAAIVWLLYNLSLPYSVFLDYPVNVISDIPGYESAARSDQRLIIRGRASGFYIIDRKLTSSREPLDIKVDGRFAESIDSAHHRFIVASNYIRKDLSAVLGDQVDIEYIMTDSLSFQLTPTDKKKVPVRLNASFDCASQYKLSSLPAIMPDSVYISGRSSLVSSIDAVWTERLSRSGLDANFQAVAVLSKIKGVDLSVSSVMYSVDVRRYVEETIELPIVVRNLPPDLKAVVIPDHVNMRFRRWYPLFGEVEPKDFELVIDYNAAAGTSSSMSVPTVSKYPAETFDFETEPVLVECIYLIQ